MNNSFYDETNRIEYIIPAPRQLERHEAELAMQLALESYAEQALDIIGRVIQTRKKTSMWL